MRRNGRAAINRYKLLMNKATANEESLRFSDTKHVCGVAYILLEDIPAMLRIHVRHSTLGISFCRSFLTDPRREGRSHCQLTGQNPRGDDKIYLGAYIPRGPSGYEAYLPEFTTIVTLVAFNLVLYRHFPIPQYPLPFRHRDSSYSFQRR